MWYVVTEKPQNQQFISLCTDTPSDQQDLDIICLAMQTNTCMGHEIPLLKALKMQQNSSLQYCAEQETGKCYVVQSAQRLGRLAGLWIGLKQVEQMER